MKSTKGNLIRASMASAPRKKECILLNSGICLKCNVVVVSEKLEDHSGCFCGNVIIGGGKVYLGRSVVDRSLYRELSEVGVRPKKLTLSLV